MQKHRNSQSRMHEEDFVYFVTANTKDGFSYFRNEILCELWVEELRFCKEMKKFELYAFCLLPNHFHLLLKPGKEVNISQIMHFLKRHFTRSANFVLGFNEGDIRECRLRGSKYEDLKNTIQIHDEKISNFRTNFIKKYEFLCKKFSRFQWQSSFHDHAIRDERDLHNHWNYTTYNFQKHELPETWKYTSLHFAELMDEF